MGANESGASSEARIRLTDSGPPLPADAVADAYARGGVYTAEAEEKEVQDSQHALFPLFVAGNEVLSALRTAQDRAKPDDQP